MSSPEKPHAAAADAQVPQVAERGPAEVVPEPAPADPAPDIAALLKRAETEAAELKDAWLRARADVDNLRKQAANDVARAHKYAIEKFAEDLLPVKDALEAALATGHAPPEALRAGVELTLKQLVAAFDKAQIVEVDPNGEKFDPHRHQAMAMIESDQPPSHVIQVFQKGYLLNDRVLRPAMVAVAKARETPA
ncbi:MAG: nucleotide exchange factor GrpE [Betaproteobacteria bacterium]|jgi:molecular chaperone GrpE|nr:nucleotide exchange factor GrpE [Betaproteobacteria bacterium]MBK6602960.1 nucleotide exchange factor GrpE [Betaproteobacteria bacterium]MBK7080015.1 nucleotide exchange factor GrpE [Betaproteobacteria bacterium]MBK7593018.1 nucleotide exchange factor GrpE [Betaproteobacteria bacterium]MBK7743314.1 nucleotide exchange factor GrpE [Betaproteobacteria bacterium]